MYAIVIVCLLSGVCNKAGMDWRLGKITAVKGIQVSVMYSVRGAKVKLPHIHTVQRSTRDVSIIYSAGDLMVNTRDHFSALKELA